MEAWRLIRKNRCASACTGEGARLYGGRWNQRGTPVVYLADSLSLAALELFVHLVPAEKNFNFTAYRLQLPKELPIERLTIDQLPRNWRSLPAPPGCGVIGTEWVNSGQTALLQLPSVLVPTQTNLLLNPEHDDFQQIEIEEWGDFSFDPGMRK